MTFANLKILRRFINSKGSSVYIKRYVRLSVCYTFVCPPGDKHFSHTGGEGGDKQIVCPRGTNIFLYMGGTNIFLMMMIIVENVSGANIPSSKARKPPAGARILGP